MIDESKYEKVLKASLEAFFGIDIIFKKNHKIILQSKLDKKVKELTKYNLKKLMNIAQEIVNDLDIRKERLIFVNIIEEIIYTYINRNILDIEMSEQKHFFDQLKRLSGETYENINSNINILLFSKEKNIERDLESLNLELIKCENLEIKDLFNSKLTLKLLDGKNNILVMNNKLKVIGIAKNKNKNIIIKSQLSKNLKKLDNSLLRYFFYLYINSLIKEDEKIKMELEELSWVVEDDDIKEIFEIEEEILEIDIKNTYKEYKRLMGDFILIEIENTVLNLYLNNSLDNYLSFTNSHWKYKSFYLFKFLIIEKLYKDRLIKYSSSNLQNNESMEKVIENINLISELLKSLIISKKGALILILKEDIVNFQESINMDYIEKKLDQNFLLSKFSFESDVYKKIILEEEKSLKITDFHFNFINLLLTIDGALILDSSFNILSFGQLIRLNTQGKELGARTNAAISASSYAVALKVSEDGEVSMYDKGKLIIKI